MSLTLIISPTTVKERTGIHSNIDEKMIVPEIRNAQEMFLAPILGTALYKKVVLLIEEYKTDSTTGLGAEANVQYKTLVDDFLVDCLVNYTLMRLGPALAYQMTNRGVQQKQADNSVAPDSSPLYRASAEYKSVAEHYRDRTIRFLRQNAPTTFPEYINWGNGIDDMPPERNAYTCPVYLGDVIPQSNRPFEDNYQGNGPR